MKTMLLTLMAAATVALAADTKDTARWIDSITLAPVGALKTADITGHSEWGAGVDLGVKLNPFVSLHVVNLAFEGPGHTTVESKKGSTTTGPHSWGGSVVDETALLAKARIARFSTETVSLYGIGGGLRDWTEDDWGFSAGAGVELAFSKRFSLAADYSLRAWFNRDKDSLLRALVNISF